MSNSAINILVADHSRSARLIFREAAAGTAVPVNVIETDDCRECMDHLARGTTDMAFIDIHMPNLSGREALWRARSVGPKTFITLMSGWENDRFVELARKLKANEFLFKPFGCAEVQAIIKTYRRISVPMHALIVDDSAAIRKIVRKVLAAGPFQIGCDEAPDGATALARCQADNYDIVFLDCNMPGLDGLQILNHLIERNPQTKVIMISGQGTKDQEIEALNRGAIALLQKPFQSGDVDALLHDLYGVPSPNRTTEGTSFPNQFDVAIIGRTISVTHKHTGHIYEYLWFPGTPYLRLGEIWENRLADRFSRKIRAKAERVAILELKLAKLLHGVADNLSLRPANMSAHAG